jgi:predicted MPP superfamily phosphohydrolase
VANKISEENKQSRFSRRGALKLMTAGAGACVANAFLVEPNLLNISRHEIIMPHLPGALDGLRVGVMADFHFDPEKDHDLVARAVARVARENLDLVLLPGDFVTGSHKVIPPLLEHLSSLRTRHGVFASVGNHDGWHGSRAEMRRRFEKAGISLLVNRNSLVSIRNETLAIAATDFVWLGKPDPAATLRGIHRDTPVISLVHEPDYFDTMTRHRRIDLQVSGHTHGGQCRIPFVSPTPVKVRFGEKYVRGAFEEGDSRLFVTRGIGTTGLRVRFACPPELAILTLRGVA